MKKYLNLWVPFAFAEVLSLMALYGFNRGASSMPPGFPAFFSFLPMTFFLFAALVQKHISGLEKRIQTLERQAAPGAARVQG